MAERTTTTRHDETANDDAGLLWDITSLEDQFKHFMLAPGVDPHEVSKEGLLRLYESYKDLYSKSQKELVKLKNAVCESHESLSWLQRKTLPKPIKHMFEKFWIR